MDEHRLIALCAEKLRRLGAPEIMAQCGRIEIYMARAHALKRKTDEQIAAALYIDIATLATWAWNCKEFFYAITPTTADLAAYDAKVLKEREKRRRHQKSAIKKRPEIKIELNVRSRVWAMVKGKATEKGVFRRFGYTPKDLIAHLESLFRPGMTWANYGKRWHVDHVKPCSKFDMRDPAQFAECWSLKNLQPLWARENLVKGARYAGA